jgi:hypothetical protein
MTRRNAAAPDVALRPNKQPTSGVCYGSRFGFGNTQGRNALKREPGSSCRRRADRPARPSSHRRRECCWATICSKEAGRWNWHRAAKRCITGSRPRSWTEMGISLPHIGRGLSRESQRRFIAATRNESRGSRLCLEGQPRPANASDFHPRFAGVVSGRRHRCSSGKRYRAAADCMKEQRSVRADHRRCPRHRQARGWTETAFAVRTDG